MAKGLQRVDRALFTRDYAQALLDKHGNASAAARFIGDEMARKGQPPIPFNTIRLWIAGAVKGELDAATHTESLSRIAALLQRNGIDPADVGNIKRIRLGGHKGFIKNKDGDIEYTKTLAADSIIFTPTWEDGPKWPVIQAAPPVTVKYNPPTIIVPKGLRVEIVAPDTQIGYQRNLDSHAFDGTKETYELLPMHDEAAMDCATQIVAAVQPDGFTQLGDLFDFSEFSRYLQVEQFWRTTQASIDRAHRYLATTKAVMGKPRRRGGKVTPKRLRLVDGNHDWKRLATYLQQNARAAFGLRPAATTPKDWPDLSVPHLLRLDELGYEHFGMWPGSEAWLVEGENGLVVTHDPKKKGFYSASLISGHTHHHRQETFTVRTPGGLREFTHYEIGCLCSLGTISQKGSIQRTRVPSDAGFVQGWAQGVAIVEILEDTGRHQLTFVRITAGEAVYGGQRFRAAA